MNAAKSEFFILSKKGKPMRRIHFECACCRQKFVRKKVFVDHINPVIDPNIGKTTLQEYIDRLFCGLIGLQILCKTDHDAKTKAENKIRRQVRKEKQNG